MLMAKRPHLSPLDHDADTLGQLRQQLDRLGLHVACLAGYTDFCLGADSQSERSRRGKPGNPASTGRRWSDKSSGRNDASGDEGAGTSTDLQETIAPS